MASKTYRAADAPDAASIIDGLGGSHATGMCRCPAHDDRKASLHVSEGAGGKVLFHCFARCSQEAVIDALRSGGLWSSTGKSDAQWQREKAESDEGREKIRRAHKLLHAATKEQPHAYLRSRGIEIMPATVMMLAPDDTKKLTGKNCPAMVFPIRDTDGRVEAAHVTWLNRNANGKLVLPDDGSPRRMFGKVKGGFVQLLPLDPDRPLIIGEGIETVLSAMQLTGLPGIAALSATNMGSINPPPCSEYIICADNDAPGIETAEWLAKRLSWPGRLTDRVVRIAVAPGEGRDWNDCLRDAKGEADKAKLRDLILKAKTVERSTPGSIGIGGFMQHVFPPRRFLLRPWLTTTGLAMAFAEAGVGKTRLALSVGYAVASGSNLLGWKCEHRAPVLYVDGEMPGELLQRWLAELGPPPPDGDFQILSSAILEAQGVTMPDLATKEGREFVDEIIERNQTELVILDSVSTLVRTGIENDVESWRELQQWSLKHRQRGRAVIYLHHASRSGQMRGTSIREVVVDTIIRLKREPDLSTDNETAIELSFPKSRHFFGKDTVPQIVRFRTTDGTIEWRAEPKPAAQQDQVADMLTRGMTQKQIAEELGLTEARISQIAHKLKKPKAA